MSKTMTENQLIAKIKQLKEIKPRQEWVGLVQEQILAEEARESQLSYLFSLIFKPALAGALSVAVLTVIFVFSQSSLPGDLLYPLKKLTEKGEVLLVAQTDLPSYELKKANKRLEEISKLVQAEGRQGTGGKQGTERTEPTKKLQPVINEFKQNVSEAAKTLVRAQATSSDPVIIKKLVEETKRLEENKNKVEKLGVALGGTEDLDKALAKLVEKEMEELKRRAPSETQKELFEHAKQDYENGDYAQALEKILLLSYPPR